MSPKKGFCSKGKEKVFQVFCFSRGLSFVFFWASNSLVVGILPLATPFRATPLLRRRWTSPPGISCWVVRVHPAVREIRMLYRRELGWCAGQPAVEVTRYTPLKMNVSPPKRDHIKRKWIIFQPFTFRGYGWWKKSCTTKGCPKRSWPLDSCSHHPPTIHPPGLLGCSTGKTPNFAFCLRALEQREHLREGFPSLLKIDPLRCAAYRI